MLSSVIKCSKLSLKITSVDHALATKQWVAVTATRWRRETNEKELLASWGYSRWLLEIPRRRRKESVCLSKWKFNIQTTTTSDNIFLDTWTSGEVSLSFLILIIVRYVKLRQRNQEIQSCEKRITHNRQFWEKEREKEGEKDNHGNDVAWGPFERTFWTSTSPTWMCVLFETNEMQLKICKRE